MKTLVILAHPNLDESIANKRIAEQLSAKVEKLEVRDIFNLYPDYKIDIKAEQNALIDADTVIFQYPFYWYNMPAILKVWFDEVFNFNFAYGPEGDKLKGKNFMLSFTIGGPDDAYSPLGYNHFRIPDFLKPMEQSAYLAQMNYLEPVYEHGMVYIPGVYNTKEAVEEKSDVQVQRLVERLDALANENPENKIKKFAKDWFEHFDLMADDGYFNNYIANGAKLQFPEGEFIGHEGFSQWYANMKKNIKPNNEHRIESINVSANNGHFDVDLAVKLKAETFEGESIQINAKENWKVEITRDGRVKIHEYIVKTV
ncbi:NAD(P)H-dependent oxidoreductase [Marinifilum caeruleilacunae]|uniref:Flavodoxin family protein n=1 Tax=Marinifilum caeruleilacunae TaxID=2499076 RepID=A0ABX1WQK5_9BACT|nr:NAD(P)H-dependent oxidoreductase [Marinifilum caeruleilacunae]NOU58276.1 flavodoxin family protein [Marinifilum caeruleilacunae]